jgi:hypothetical protein
VLEDNNSFILISFIISFFNYLSQGTKNLALKAFNNFYNFNKDVELLHQILNYDSELASRYDK